MNFDSPGEERVEKAASLVKTPATCFFNSFSSPVKSKFILNDSKSSSARDCPVIWTDAVSRQVFEPALAKKPIMAA